MLSHLHDQFRQQNIQLKDLLKLPKLWIAIEPSDQKKDQLYRENLRRHLIQELTFRVKERAFSHPPDMADALHELISIKDLSQIPQVSFANISIAHCPSAGGYAYTDPEFNLGFDLEETGRVSENLIRRVSDEQEVSLAPDATSLWVAKESAYKSLLGKDQPKVLSAVKIAHWNMVQQIFTFSFEVQKTSATTEDNSPISNYGIGCVTSTPHFKMGICLHLS